jgi:hypothetical protein
MVAAVARITGMEPPRLEEALSTNAAPIQEEAWGDM